MRQKIANSELLDWIKEMKNISEKGRVASYIPALKDQDPNNLGISVCYLNGEQSAAGDVNHLFTLQSVSKVIALAFALMDNSEEEVFSKVGMEPTGDPFHSIAKLETAKPSKPLNPMINAGALAVTNLIKGDSPTNKIERLLNFVGGLAGDEHIFYNEEVAESEFETAFLNRSLSYFMKQNKIIKGDVEELLDVYCKQCAIELNIRQLSRIGAILANDGKDVGSEEILIPKQYARICKTFMVTCGMYDESGSFAIRVGIPAKSGVSGAIMGSVKDFGGIGVFGPGLDEKGNSVVGLRLLEKISKQLELSIF